MTTFLLLLASASPAQPATTAVEVAPAPVVVPDAKQIAAWVADLSSQDYNYGKQRVARDSLVRAGPRAKSAIPDLIKMLGGEDNRVGNAAEVLGALGPDAKDAVPHLLAALTPKTYGFTIEQIAVALAKLDAPKLEATRALLLRPSGGHDVTLLGSQYLQEYAPLVVPHVVELCRDRDAKVRAKAAELLGSLETRVFPRGHSAKAGVSLLALAGDGAKGIPAALEKLLGDDDVAVRLAAATAIARVAPQLAEQTIPVVIAAMRDEKLSAKLTHIQASEIFSPIPGPAAKALIPLFDSNDDRTREWAINTLASLPVREPVEAVLKNGKTARARQAAAITLGSQYAEGPRAASALKAGLTDTEFVVRFAAAESLVRLGGRGSDTAAAAIPVLIEGLKQDAAETIRSAASQILVSVGPPAKVAVPDLKRLFADGTPAVALEAALAVVELVPTEATDAIPVLIRGLSAADRPAARSAKALATIGPAAKTAVPELIKLFDAKDIYLRMTAAEAAARIDPAQAPKATELLVGLLKQKQFRRYTYLSDATQSLVRIGPGAKAATPTLLELLKDDSPFHAEMALAVVAIDPENAKPARDWMQARLKDGDVLDNDSFELADQLSELGPKAKPFIPELMLLLKWQSQHFRRNAVETLGAIGPDAKDALPQLKEIAEKDQRPNIRKLAAEAVKKIEAK